MNKLKFIKNILFVLAFVVIGFSINGAHAEAANRFWVGGGSSTNWNATTPTNWSATSGGANNATVPTATDDVFFNASSGSGTAVLSANTNIRSIDFTGFTGTFDQSQANRQLGISANNVNVVVKFSSTMTYLINSSTSTPSKIAPTGASCATSCNISWTTAGKIMPAIDNMTVLANRTISLQDDYTSSLYIRFQAGTLTTNNHNVSTLWFQAASSTSVTTLNLGSTTWTITGTNADAPGFGSVWIADTASSNLIVNAGTSTIKIMSSSSGSRTFLSTGVSSTVYNNVWFTGTNTGSISVNGNNTFNNFTIDSPTSSVNFEDDGNGVSDTFNTFNFTGGVSGRMVNMTSSSVFPCPVLSLPSGTVNLDYVAISNLTVTGGSTWNVGVNSIDNGTATGFTWEDSGLTRYWVGGGSSTNWNATSPTNWSTTSGGPRDASVPVSSTRVYFDSKSLDQAVVLDTDTLDLKSIDFTGFRGSLNSNGKVLRLGHPASDSVFKFSPTMNFNFGDNTAYVRISGDSCSSSCTIPLTTAGKSMPLVYIEPASNVTVSLQDDYTSSLDLYIWGGVFTTNNHNISSRNIGFTGNVSNTTLNMGSSTWTITGSGTTSLNFTGNGYFSSTFNAGTSTFKFTDSSSDDKWLDASSFNFYNLWFSGTGTGEFRLNGDSNTFNEFRVDNPPGNVHLCCTNTINSIIANGTVGNLITFQTSGTPATISSSSGTINLDYVSLTNVNVTGGATFYAGAHSTNGGGNGGWIFDSPPTADITYYINHAVKAGDTQRITATFSEAVQDSPVMKIAISGNNTVSATNMTKTDTTHYYYDYTVGTGDGTDTVALSVGLDGASLPVISAPTSGATFTVDNTSPTAVLTYSKDRNAAPIGQTQRILATFSEPIADSPVVKIAISGKDNLSASDMTKIDSTHYYYDYFMSGSGGVGVDNVTLSVGTDAAGNVVTPTPTSGGSFTTFKYRVGGDLILSPSSSGNSAGGMATVVTSVRSGTSVPQVTITRNLKITMKGDDVKTLQAYLKLTPDGVFGAKTKQSVIKFQKANKLTPDGVVGPKTRAIVNKK